MTTTSINQGENTPTANMDDRYEELASQEEIYLEQIEENLRAIAICELDVSRSTESDDDVRECLVEDLLTGDSDDPLLDEETNGGMCRDL
jgi:hypothetical protein